MNIYDLTRKQLEEKMITYNEKPFRATQVFEWLYKKNVHDFAQMTNISASSRENLENSFNFSDLTIIKVQTSSDGTKKYLFELEDKELIETVLMRHNYGLSVCVSTQVGCNMGCKFCASGLNKKKRNLTVAEMVLQVLLINQDLEQNNERVSHVVIMGIGEPFDNYTNVLNFVRIINDSKGLEIGSRHITISTCGLVDKIKEFSDFELQVNLAISLHFSNDTLRNQYMPISKKYDLTSLMNAINYYFEKTSRRITYEYILLDGINDDEKSCKELINLLKGQVCYVNLIPMNETSGKFKRSSKEATDKFYDLLMKNHINVTLRKEQGHDIDAACGQLRIKSEKEKCKD